MNSSKRITVHLFAFFTLFFAIAGIFLWLGGCKPTTRTRSVPTYKHSTNGAPINMDPVKSATRYANLMVTSIYDTLYEYKYLARPYALKSCLAAGMPVISDDKLTYIITLKKGIHYIDDPCFPDGVGREVNVYDFIFGLKRHFDPSALSQGNWLWQDRIVGLDQWKANGSNYEEGVEGLKALDDYTVQITLVEPYPQLLYTLAMGFSAVIPREAVEFYGEEFGIKPVGSGPYILESFNTKKAVLVKNSKFREEFLKIMEEGFDQEIHGSTGVKQLEGARLPIMERVEVSFIQEPNTRWQSFKKGTEIQYATIPLEQVPHVTENLNPLILKPKYAEKYDCQNLPDFGLVMTYFNMLDPEIGYNEDPAREQRNFLLRKAIRYAYDWPQRNRRFYNDIGIIFPGVIPVGLDAHDPNLSRDSVTPDYEKARAMLTEGGWHAENLPELEWCSVASTRSTQFFEQFRGWMEKISYPRDKVKMVTFANFGDYNKAVKNSDCMIFGMGWGLDYPDSENVLQLFYGPNKAPGSNASSYDNPEFNELFDKAKVMLPSPERTAIYRQLNEIIIRDCPTILGLTRNTPYVWHNNVVMYPSENVHGSIFKYIKVLDKSN